MRGLRSFAWSTSLGGHGWYTEGGLIIATLQHSVPAVTTQNQTGLHCAGAEAMGASVPLP